MVEQQKDNWMRRPGIKTMSQTMDILLKVKKIKPILPAMCLTDLLWDEEIIREKQILYYYVINIATYEPLKMMNQ